jgi:hypothetical protein
VVRVWLGLGQAERNQVIGFRAVHARLEKQMVELKHSIPVLR